VPNQGGRKKRGKLEHPRMKASKVIGMSILKVRGLKDLGGGRLARGKKAGGGSITRLGGKSEKKR